MEYKPTWNLSTIPEDALRSEVARRNNARRSTFGGGRPVTCGCGKCKMCRARLAKALSRERARRSESEGVVVKRESGYQNGEL